MSSLSLNRLLAIGAVLYHITLAVPQAPLAQVTDATTFLPPAQQANQGSSNGCGQCQLVADVAGLVWYSQVFINDAATNLVQVGVNNASRTTRTSLIQNEGEFTYNPAASDAVGGALTQVNFEPSVTVAGAVLYVTINSLFLFKLKGPDKKTDAEQAHHLPRTMYSPVTRSHQHSAKMDLA